MSGKVKRYRDKKDQHRWNVKARNGNVLADSGEGYARLRGAEAGAVATAVAILADPVLGPRVLAKAGLVRAGFDAALDKHQALAGRAARVVVG